MHCSEGNAKQDSKGAISAPVAAVVQLRLRIRLTEKNQCKCTVVAEKRRRASKCIIRPILEKKRHISPPRNETTWSAGTMRPTHDYH